MTEIVNPNRSSIDQVEKFIGTSYDKMVTLYNNLDYLLNLNNELAEYNGKNLGVLDSAPTTRNDGSELQQGDAYISSVGGVVYFYLNGNWIQQGALNLEAEVVYVTADMLQGGKTVITTANPYKVGQNALSVYVGGVLQTSTLVDPDNGNFAEVTSTVFHILDELLVGEKVDIKIGVPIDTINLSVAVHQGFLSIDVPDANIVVLPDDMTYAPNSNNLVVIKNGNFLTSGVHYYEISNTQITLIDPVAIGDQFTFRAGNIVSNTERIGDSVEAINTISTFYALGNTLDRTKVVITKGAITPVDGQSGTYVYDPSMPQGAANGVTIIDTTKQAATQGTGTGSGCWIRQYSDYLTAEWFGSPYVGMAAFRFMSPVSGDRYDMPSFHEVNSEFSASGGGKFIFDASRSKTDHNGITVISPDKLTNPTDPDWYTSSDVGADSGCWVREPTPSISLYDAGYIYNGSVVGDVVIAAVIANDLTVCLPSGINLDSTVDLAGTKVYSYGSVAQLGSGEVLNYKDLLA